jgi:hypothetical protein
LKSTACTIKNVKTANNGVDIANTAKSIQKYINDLISCV